MSKDFPLLLHIVPLDSGTESFTPLHFSICATKIISSHKLTYCRTNKSATKKSSRVICRAKVVKKDFARQILSMRRAIMCDAHPSLHKRFRDDKIVRRTKLRATKWSSSPKQCTANNFRRAGRLVDICGTKRPSSRNS